MPVVPATPQSIDRAATLLRNGGVVAFPTETVYGLGAHAFDPRGVARIFEIKRRPAFDPLIVHVLDEAMLARVAAGVPSAARTLIERFWPGPLTLVLPAHPVARALLERAAVPLAAPSANPFGYLSPTRASHVARMLGESVDLILDGGPAQHGLESTIVLLEPAPALLRPGAISIEAIEAAIGPLARDLSDEGAPLGPGRLPSHYAPRTPLRLIDPQGVPLDERAGAGFVALARPAAGYAEIRLLSERSDLREAAARLFDALHELDQLGLARIDVEPLPEHGLGIAMMDRLRRAAAG
jgi:L-threonylcarbamoyladenylate synthase